MVRLKKLKTWRIQERKRGETR